MCVLVPCHGGSRFPALPYMAVFNVGVLTAGWVRLATEGKKCLDRAFFLSMLAVFCMPFAYLYALKLRVGTTQGVHDTLLTDHFSEIVFPSDITRIPPTPAWLLGTLGVGLVVFVPCIIVGIV